MYNNGVNYKNGGDDMYTVSLEAARINAGFSQKEAAKRVGVNATTLANWEKGKTVPDIDKFRKLC